LEEHAASIFRLEFFKEKGRMFVRNVGIHLQHSRMPQPRRLQYQYIIVLKKHPNCCLTGEFFEEGLQNVSRHNTNLNECDFYLSGNYSWKVFRKIPSILKVSQVKIWSVVLKLIEGYFQWDLRIWFVIVRVLAVAHNNCNYLFFLFRIRESTTSVV
jgi:hypothetical protein